MTRATGERILVLRYRFIGDTLLTIPFLRNLRRAKPDACIVWVVAHDSDATSGAPTLESYFFDKIRPRMERALKENRRDRWPLIVLNLDFKTNERALHDAVWELLGKYERWLTTAPRTLTPHAPAALTVGPTLPNLTSESTLPSAESSRTVLRRVTTSASGLPEGPSCLS